jgi:hypothetical protein
MPSGRIRGGCEAMLLSSSSSTRDDRDPRMMASTCRASRWSALLGGPDSSGRRPVLNLGLSTSSSAIPSSPLARTRMPRGIPKKILGAGKRTAGVCRRSTATRG